MRSLCIVPAAVMSILLFCGGCASYTTPSRGADFSTMRESQTDADVAEALAKKPLAKFPASIAIVRIESSGYKSATAQSWGSGKFSIVTTHDVESPATFESLQKLPQVAGLAPINRLLLPQDLQSYRDLRQAAGSLHADMLLIYTIDTVFQQQDLAEPLTLITLGLAPDQKIQVVSTASAALLDTRNGYVYGVCEETEHRSGLTIGWSSDAAVDDARQKTESKAFDKMAGQFQTMWAGVVKQYQEPAKTGS
jgi:hypothetical protein